jgi:pyruvate dehydrogenase E1 component alpha subunit
MPKKVVHAAATYRLEILDKDGKADRTLMPDLAPDQLLWLYAQMVRLRRFDEKALNLQRQGRLGTYASMRGQEAAQVGVGLALEPQDWVIPSFREHGLQILHGYPPHLVYAFWKGDERGSAPPEGVRCLPPSIPVGSQLLHAAGLALSLKLKGEKGAAVGCAGDGASSEGDFHEALNFAGVFGAPAVFLIQNNQWAISVPFKRQTAAQTIAQRAHGYGIQGIQVDGNDVLAVYAAAKEALERARSGGGATLIEALTYRMENHTTADDAVRYRPAEELEYWKARDPIDRMRKFLVGKKLWSDAKEEALLLEAASWVEGEVAALEAMPTPAPSDMFDHMYKEIPWNLRRQRDELLREVGG